MLLMNSQKLLKQNSEPITRTRVNKIKTQIIKQMTTNFESYIHSSV